MHVKKGDQVIVISGDYKGSKGRILKVYTEKNRVIIEGVNIVKRHMRPSQQYPNGGIIEREAPIHASNVMVLCPSNNLPTRVSSKVLDGEEKLSRRRTRYSKKYDEIISYSE